MINIKPKALLYCLSDSEVNATRLRFGIPVKTERSRLITTLLYDISSKNDTNTLQVDFLYALRTSSYFQFCH